MPASVHPSSIQRWYETLCRFKVDPIRRISNPSGTGIARSALPNVGAVYAFWWVGDFGLLKQQTCMRDVIVRGPGGEDVEIYIDDEWLGISASCPIPLYVGKTTGLAQRVRGHLELGNERLLPLGGGARKAPRPTTVCQLRAGIDHLFPDVTDTRTLLLDSVALSYVVLDGSDHAANRFYLEDYAIGLMRPCLNIDVER